MKRKVKIILLTIAVLSAVIIIGWLLNIYLNKQPPKEPEELRILIIKSIEIPFVGVDTVIIETDWEFCGNSPSWELPIVFDIQLEEEANKTKLTQHIKKHIFMMSEFNVFMDSIKNTRFEGKYPPSLWDVCRVNKVHVQILAEKLSSKNVRTYENYLFNDEVKFIQKDFHFADNKWTYTISDSLMHNM